MGKTALLFECEKHARAREWKVAEIGVRSLWDPNQMLDSLGLGDKYEVTEKSTQFGWKNVFGRGYKSTRPEPTVEKVLRDGSQPLLLILDEAQALADKDVPPPQHKASAIHVLEFIHNGKLGRPVILLAAGLGTTKEGFSDLKISRFADNCFVELGPLSKEDERAVIQDWITEEGGAKGDPTAWIDAIAQETHGWPQHIQTYVNRAVTQLKANNGVMTPGGLSAALEAGREGRKVYYKQRVEDFRADQLRCLARVIPAVPQRAPAEYRDIVSSLAQEYGEDGAQDLFRKLESEGLLTASGMGYSVPIPSMHAWLKDVYGRERIETPPAPTMGHTFHERDSGRER